jgi:hypothetical protein
MEVSFRFKAAPYMVFTKTNPYDIEQMRKHSEYEEIKEEVKQEPKKVGRPKKADTGEE